MVVRLAIFLTLLVFGCGAGCPPDRHDIKGDPWDHLGLTDGLDPLGECDGTVAPECVRESRPNPSYNPGTCESCMGVYGYPAACADFCNPLVTVWICECDDGRGDIGTPITPQNT